MLTKTVKEYKLIQLNIDSLIKQSGFTIKHIYEKMGMDKTSFYLKRKAQRFTPDEIERLLNIIKIDKLPENGRII